MWLQFSSYWASKIGVAICICLFPTFLFHLRQTPTPTHWPESSVWHLLSKKTDPTELLSQVRDRTGSQRTEETPPSPAGSWWQVTDAPQDTEPTRTENSQGQTQDGPWWPRTGLGQTSCPVPCSCETCPFLPLHPPMLFPPQSTLITPFSALYPSSKHPTELLESQQLSQTPNKTCILLQDPQLSFSSVTKSWLTVFKDTPERFFLWPITKVSRVLAFVTVTDSSCYSLCICVQFIILDVFCFCLLRWIAINYIFFQSA